MPILDHFRPPLSQQRIWNTFHHAWAATIARQLNRQILSADYFAAPSLSLGPRVEIDVATMEESHTRQTNGDTLTYAAPPATEIVPFSLSQFVEVKIFQTEGGPELVAAIEIVSPANKDRPENRRAFTAKMATYLHEGVSLIVVDLVTSRTAHLHNHWIEQFQIARGRLPEHEDRLLYANSYRPMPHEDQDHLAMWLHALAVGEELPNLPLFLLGDDWVEIPFEDTYIETCGDQRIEL